MRNAIVTASYAPDFERCAVLCETVDRHASGYECHYLLVDVPDRDLFSRLEGPKRKVITDAELLPWWLRRVPAALSPRGRRLWVSPATVPLRGWHVQQLMRIAVAHRLDVDGLLYCDSDTALVKPFDVNDIWRDGAMRLYGELDGARTAQAEHLVWADHAARALRLPGGAANPNDYVCSFVSWRRQTVVDMCTHIERVRRRPWASVIGSSRRFSECMLYGAYVDSVLGGAGHVHDPKTYCPMKWFKPAPGRAELTEMVDNLEDGQVAIGVQSFLPVPVDDFREVVTQLPRAA
ncbi:DUF6492 family protein [Oricola sp.]|uniref:DUF6492 family protein n=1 Tax=Oricola sp. TaxID=1979950 RepID=UPI003BA8D990